MAEFLRRTGFFLLVIISAIGCNLSTSPGAVATVTAFPTDLPVGAIITGVPTGVIEIPTLTDIPLPDDAITRAPVTSVPALGGQCEVYMTYSGNDPANVLSLRREPDAASYQLYLVPNNVDVLLVPGSTEVVNGGYHWLNVIYEVTPDSRYIGWIARDSFQTNGIRDESVATLIPTGTVAAC